MPRQQLYPPEFLADSSRLALLIGDAWAMRIIGVLAQERMRFNQLQHRLGISSKTLSNRLKQLESRAIVTRTLYAQVPLRVEYELTEKGFELKTLLDALVKWDKKWS